MLGSNLISALIRITTSAKINDPTSGMRLYNRTMIEQFAIRGDLTPEPETLAFLSKTQRCLGDRKAGQHERPAAGESYLTSLSHRIHGEHMLGHSLFTLV